ncbi:uncharacterized protein RAG0_05986 [Rhynchosporium agropyri]|uniref:Uncharacterized protein n=1 Tax=Rhynchosporium agropyri TaxID=914238 RepID=A0A1E1KFK6_9HELO|nr:uncharacterized protein RAG0_05986 [Rhynchosporium agropyri]
MGSYLEANKASAEGIRLLFDVPVIKINHIKSKSAELLISISVGLLLALYVAYHLLNRLHRISNSITHIIICGGEEESIIDSGGSGGVDWLTIASAGTIASTSTVASTVAATESIVSSVDLVTVLLVLIFRVILASYTSAEGSRVRGLVDLRPFRAFVLILEADLEGIAAD